METTSDPITNEQLAAIDALYAAAESILAAIRPIRSLAANLSSGLNTTDEVVEARRNLKEQLAAANARAEKAEARALADREVADNYLSHCNAACAQVDALEAERDTLSSHVEQLLAALDSVTKWGLSNSLSTPK